MALTLTAENEDEGATAPAFRSCANAASGCAVVALLQQSYPSPNTCNGRRSQNLDVALGRVDALAERLLLAMRELIRSLRAGRRL